MVATQVAEYEVFEDSAGFYIGYILMGAVIRESLYYEQEDQARAELEDGSWKRRV